VDTRLGVLAATRSPVFPASLPPAMHPPSTYPTTWPRLSRALKALLVPPALSHPAGGRLARPSSPPSAAAHRLTPSPRAAATVSPAPSPVCAAAIDETLRAHLDASERSIEAALLALAGVPPPPPGAAPLLRPEAARKESGDDVAAAAEEVAVDDGGSEGGIADEGTPTESRGGCGCSGASDARGPIADAGANASPESTAGWDSTCTGAAAGTPRAASATGVAGASRGYWPLAVRLAAVRLLEEIVAGFRERRMHADILRRQRDYSAALEADEESVQVRKNGDDDCRHSRALLI